MCVFMSKSLLTNKTLWGFFFLYQIIFMQQTCFCLSLLARICWWFFFFLFLVYSSFTTLYLYLYILVYCVIYALDFFQLVSCYCVLCFGSMMFGTDSHIPLLYNHVTLLTTQDGSHSIQISTMISWTNWEGAWIFLMFV